MGEEASVLAFVDGEHVLPMPAAQDHKRIGEGDTGPNTGGMGAYAPAPIVSPSMMDEVQRSIFAPIVNQMHQEGRAYRGILYAGLMITDRGPYVIEFNCRFGDPETQAILPLMRSDLVEPLMAVVDGNLNQIELQWDNKAAVCVVLASGGYPGEYATGLPMAGTREAAQIPDVYLFHSGTQMDGDTLVTSGGRVIGVTGVGNDIAQATKKAYEAVEKIRFEGMTYRRDIAAKALASGVT